jgi:hypothetical protein
MREEVVKPIAFHITDLSLTKKFESRDILLRGFTFEDGTTRCL